MKVCTLIYTRNYKQETIYYIQETKNASEKFFNFILKENRNFFSLFYRKQIIKE